MKKTSDSHKKIDSLFKQMGWKTASHFFYKSVNEQTLAHFIFDENSKEFNAVLGTTNLKLNRMSWDLFDLPEDFGTIPRHLSNSCRCILGIGFEIKVFEKPVENLEEVAEVISTSCTRQKSFLNSIEKLKQAMTSSPKSKVFAKALLLVAMEQMT